MAEIKDTAESSRSRSRSLREDSTAIDDVVPVPLQRSLLIICKYFSLTTGISAILCISVNLFAAVVSFKNRSDLFDGVLRITMSMAVVVVVAETEWGAFFKFWKVLEYWPGRGVLHIFVAFTTWAFSDNKGQWKGLALLQNIASYLLLSCGVVYLISGILCVGCLCLKRKLEHTKEMTRDQAAKDLEELEQKRQELEALLIEDRY